MFYIILIITISLITILILSLIIVHIILLIIVISIHLGESVCLRLPSGLRWAYGWALDGVVFRKLYLWIVLCVWAYLFLASS